MIENKASGFDFDDTNKVPSLHHTRQLSSNLPILYTPLT